MTENQKDEILRNADEIHEMILDFASKGSCPYEKAFEVVKLALLADISVSLSGIASSLDSLDARL